MLQDQEIDHDASRTSICQFSSELCYQNGDPEPEIYPDPEHQDLPLEDYTYYTVVNGAIDDPVQNCSDQNFSIDPEHFQNTPYPLNSQYYPPEKQCCILEPESGYQPFIHWQSRRETLEGELAMNICHHSPKRKKVRTNSFYSIVDFQSLHVF